MEFLRIEAVAIAVAGNDVVAVSADFPAEAGDVHVNGAVEHDDFAFPHLVQNFFSRENNALIGEEERQNLELLFCQVDVFPVKLA